MKTLQKFDKNKEKGSLSSLQKFGENFRKMSVWEHCKNLVNIIEGILWYWVPQFGHKFGQMSVWDRCKYLVKNKKDQFGKIAQIFTQIKKIPVWQHRKNVDKRCHYSRFLKVQSGYFT